MKVARNLLLVALWVAAPTLLLAQSPSKDFPIPEDCAGAAANVPETSVGEFMDVRIAVKGAGSGQLPHVSTDQIVAPKDPHINLSACMDGSEVAKSSVGQICVRALQQGYTCIGSTPAAPFPGTCDCIEGNATFNCDAAGEDFPVSLTCTIDDPTSGFFLSKPGSLAGPSVSKFEISPASPASEIISLNHSTRAGNEIGTDMLPQFLLRVTPKDVQGNNVLGDVAFRVFHNQTGQNPRNFTVNVDPTLANDPVALHNAIASGFNGLGLGLVAVVHAPEECHFSPTFRELAGVAGTFMRIGNAGAIATQINVKGQIHQEIEAETSDPALAGIPALSPIGLAVLVGIMLLSGLWLARRRQRQSQS